ncbi:MAG: ATP-binding cassette domain-containing protein [Acidimicrobiia bacterium]|nr:ATP-binding cassette domain-containing protein [Acidimicrobiia bacterium]
MLTVSGLTKSHGARVLFRDVTIRLSPGRRVALIGGNGVGKTTICEIIVGLQEPDAGEVSHPNDYRIGYLPQELMEAWPGTVLEEVLRGSGDVLGLEAELRRLEEAVADAQGDELDQLLEAYGVAQSRFEALGGYQLEAEARRILGGLGFTTDDMDRPLKEMSGGWQMRAMLARLLLLQPDLLVLDEPTNHLDVDSVAWLEQQLQNWPGALLFVSHDRDFIDAVAERCLEVAFGTAQEYVGGFAEFLVAREERLAILEATAARQAKEVARVEQFIDRFRYKATKARQVQSRIKALARLEQIEVPKMADLKLRFAFPDPPRSARVVVEIEDADIGYPDGAHGGPDVVLSGVNLVVERGQKLALIGPNGAGKSTLLKTIMGQLAPLSGRAVLGANVDVAYFAQHQVDALDMSKTVEQEFRWGVGEQPKNRNLRTVLGSFGFSGDAVDRKVGDLSGGERTRLALAEVMCNPVNLLVLDEPTNHLDLPSCDLLEDALRAYPGTVLLVSHDRYLIRNTAEQLVEVRNGRVVQHLGVDEAVLSPTGATPGSASPSGRPPAAPAARNQSSTRPAAGKAVARPVGGVRKAQRREEAEARNSKNRSTREARKRVDRLERQATQAEEELKALEQRLADPEVYADKALMNDLIDAHDKAQARTTRLLEEWEQAVHELEHHQTTTG